MTTHRRTRWVLTREHPAQQQCQQSRTATGAHSSHPVYRDYLPSLAPAQCRYPTSSMHQCDPIPLRFAHKSHPGSNPSPWRLRCTANTPPAADSIYFTTAEAEAQPHVITRSRYITRNHFHCARIQSIDQLPEPAGDLNLLPTTRRVRAIVRDFRVRRATT
jgi:hypothetical protein